MLEQGANIAAVTDRGVAGRPARPTRMATSSGRVARAASRASPTFRRTCGSRPPDTEKAHGSPPDWCQISACMTFGSTVRAQTVKSLSGP
jgi:hypothetical protein